MAKTLNAEIWLVVSQGGRWGKLNVRLALKSPSLKPGEVPIKMSVELPEALFKTPQLTAKVVVPDTVPTETFVNIEDNLAKLANEHLGVNIHFEKTVE